MSKFMYDTKVIFVGDDNQVERGSIQKTFDDLKIATVKTEKGELKKIPFDKLGMVPDPVEVEEKKNDSKKLIEKSEITITPDEFMELTVRVIVRLSKSEPMTAGALSIFSGMLHKALFIEESEND